MIFDVRVNIIGSSSSNSDATKKQRLHVLQINRTTGDTGYETRQRMKYSTILVFFVLLLTYFEICQCFTNTTALSQEKQAQAIENVTRKLKNAWTWIKQQASSEDTFVGRCAGAFKHMKMAINFIIFKLGVIVTALAFLSVLAFKTLGVGVLILILSSIGLATKFFALKSGGGHESSHSSPVHLHLYNKGGGGGGGHYHDQDHDSGWYDRLDHVVPKNQLERMAIADLYKRLRITENLYGTSDTEANNFR